MARLIGLDIGSTTIKVVELEKTGKTNKLITLGLGATPPKGLLSEASFDQMALAEAIKKTCSDAKVSVKDINVALPESLTFTRVIEMPSLSEKELASAIRWEAEQYVPLPLSEVVFDYQVVGQDMIAKGSPRMQIFFVAAPKKLVSKYQKIVSMAGFEPVSIETEVLALNRALAEASGSSPVTLVVRIGASGSTAFVSSGANILLTYALPMGGKAITRALSTDLSIDQMQAEEYKKTYGLSRDVLSGKISNALKPVLDNLVLELKRVISFYQARAIQGMPIQRAVLVGGSAKLPGLVVHLTEQLGIETQIGDPWSKISAAQQKLTGQPFDPILFSEAVGLALKPL